MAALTEADVRWREADRVEEADVRLNFDGSLAAARARQGTAPFVYIPLGRVPANRAGHPEEAPFQTYALTANDFLERIGVHKIAFALRCLSRTLAITQDSLNTPMGLMVAAASRTAFEGAPRPLTLDDFTDDFANFDEYGNALRVPRDNQPIKLDIWDPFVENEGVRQFASTIRKRRKDEQVVDYLLSMGREILAKTYERYKVEGDDDIGFQIYGVWLQVSLRPMARGITLDTLEEKDEVLKTLKKTRSIYSPRLESMCFWDSISKAVLMDTSDRLVDYVTQQVRNECYRAVSEAMGWTTDFYKDAFPLDKELICKVAQVLQYDITVVTLEQEILFMSDEYRSMTDSVDKKHIIMLFVPFKDGELTKYHWCWVSHWTSMVPTRKCPNKYCDHQGTFAHRVSYHRHVKEGRCMRCPCQKDPFPNIYQYYKHKENLMTECPLYQAAEQGEQTFERKFMKPTKPRQYADDKMPDMHMSFDIECYIPRTDANTTAANSCPHVPYAAGWYGTPVIADRPAEEHDDLQSIRPEDVTIHYGFDCMERFLDDLDEIYNRIIPEAQSLIEARINEVHADDSNEARRKRINYRKSLKRHIERTELRSCAGCDSVFRDQDQILAHFTGPLSEGCCLTVCGTEKLAAIQLEWMQRSGNMHPNSVLPRVFVYAHNGGGYDFNFLLEAMRHRYDAADIDFIITETRRFQQIKLKNLFVFRDTANVISGSLDAIGKTFGVEAVKGEFPYKLVTAENIHDTIPFGSPLIRPEYLMKSDKVNGVSITRPSSAEEMAEFWAKWPEGFPVQEATDVYLRYDVIVLHQITQKAMIACRRDLQLDFTEMMTAAGGAFKLFKRKYLQENVYPIMHPAENDKLREAYHGGRVEVHQRYLPPELQRKVEAGHARICYDDANSLYPAAQKRYMPVGHPTHIGTENTPFIKDVIIGQHVGNLEARTDEQMREWAYRLNRDKSFNDPEHTYIIWCEFEPPQDPSVIPVVPQRIDEKTMFTLYCAAEAAVCEPEFIEMMRAGYVIKRIHHAMRWSRGQPFDSYVDTLGEQKATTMDKIYRAFIKLLLNGLYGRLAMAAKPKTTLVDNNYDASRLVNNDRYVTSVLPFSSTMRRGQTVEWALVSQRSVVPDNKDSNVAMASFVTSHARCILLEFVRKVQELPQKDERIVAVHILYMDTDSLIYVVETDEETQVSELYEDVEGTPVLSAMKEMFHQSTIGLWKDELAGKEPAKDVVCVAPKFYVLKFQDDTEKAAIKGIKLRENYTAAELMPFCHNGAMAVEGVNFDAIKRLVLHDIQAIRTRNELWVNHPLRGVATIDIGRVLSAAYTKRKLCPDGCTTRPLMDHDQPASKRFRPAIRDDVLDLCDDLHEQGRDLSADLAFQELQAQGYFDPESQWLAREEEEMDRRFEAGELTEMDVEFLQREHEAQYLMDMLDTMDFEPLPVG